jgi:hypothetical protein
VTRQFKPPRDQTVTRQFKPLRKYQYGPKGGKKYAGSGGDAGGKGYYEEDDNDKLFDMLRDLLDWSDPAAAAVELTSDELFNGRPGPAGDVVVAGLRQKGVPRETVDFIFRRFDWCTRWQVQSAGRTPPPFPVPAPRPARASPPPLPPPPSPPPLPSSAGSLLWQFRPPQHYALAGECLATDVQGCRTWLGHCAQVHQFRGSVPRAVQVHPSKYTTVLGRQDPPPADVKYGEGCRTWLRHCAGD